MVLRIMYVLILAGRPSLPSGTLRPPDALCPLSPAEEPGRRGQYREDAGTPLTEVPRRLCFSLVTIHTFAAGRVDKGRVGKGVGPGRNYDRGSVARRVGATAGRWSPCPAGGAVRDVRPGVAARSDGARRRPRLCRPALVLQGRQGVHRPLDVAPEPFALPGALIAVPVTGRAPAGLQGRE